MLNDLKIIPTLQLAIEYDRTNGLELLRYAHNS